MAPSKALIHAVRQVLHPLARLLLARGLTYPQLAELLKAVLVQVAEKEFPIAGRQQTDSRISLLTGVHRKDVRRLRGPRAGEESVTARSVSLGAQLVAEWTGRRRFRDADGHPLPLPRLASQGGGVSFEGLVERVSKDIRSRVVLDEFLRLGVARMDEQDRVVLNVEAFIPRGGPEEKLHYLGHNLRDHTAAATHNVLGAGEPLLERSVHYDALSRESIRELAALAEKGGMEAVQTLNQRAIELEERDAGAAEKHRFTFGVYFFHAPTGGNERQEE